MFGWDDALALANTKAGGSFGQGLGAALGGGGPVTSSTGALDGRGWLDGSGWTVATGAGKATGGDRDQASDPAAATMAGGASQAGMGGLPMLLLLGLLVAGFMRRAKP